MEKLKNSNKKCLREMKKERADILLVKKGLAESREEAKKIILAGKLRINKDHIVRKASEMLSPNSELSVDFQKEFVSRGAYKLLPAITEFPPPKLPFVAADIGASTGGFTDLLLKKGAKKVYAVDAGKNQLHPSLKIKHEVICLEKTNARYLSENEIPEKLDVVTIDVSFISVKKILPALSPLLANTAMIYILLKPQFEAKRNEVKKGGVVKDINVIKRCCEEIANFAKIEFNWELLKIIPSPIKGPKGNQEQILVMKK